MNSSPMSYYPYNENPKPHWIPGAPTNPGWCWLRFKNEYYTGNEKTEPEFENKVDWVLSFSNEGFPRLRYSSNVHLIIAHCPLEEPEE